MEQRTDLAVKNVTITFSFKILMFFVTFVTRILFVNILGKEILGVSSVFTSILTILSIAELGLGEAVAFALYKPIKEGNYDKINSIVAFVRKAYWIISIIIIAFGLVFMPFLGFIIGESINLENIYLIYLLTVIHSASGYFGSARRILLGADQKKYKEATMQFIVGMVYNAIQIVLLYVFKNYIFYLVMQIGYVLVETLFGVLIVNKEYKWLNLKNAPKLLKDERTHIFRNLYALIFQKLQAVLHNSFPNVILSIYYGTEIVAVYSNYIFIYNTVLAMLVIIFTALLGSIGNAIVSLTKSEILTIFNQIDFASFWLFSFCTIGLFNLVSPFVLMAYGEDYLLPVVSVALFSLHFYILGMRQPVVAFKNSFGLYWQDRYKPFVNMAINLILSLVLIKPFGINGALIAMVLSYVLINSWIEPLVLHRDGLHASVKPYYYRYLFRLVITVLLSFGFYYLFALFSLDVRMIDFIIKAIIMTFVINVTFILLFVRTKEFKYYKNLALSKLRK